METRANYAIIGAFTLAVVAAVFGFVYWFSGSDSSQRRQPIRIVFSGSVAGLATGSFVQFNGIRVGEVTQVRLLPEDPRRVEAVVEIDRNTPLRSDTRARLEAALLTGVTTIALVGGDPSAPPLAPGPREPMPTIFADKADFQDLMESVRAIARRADDVLERVGKVVSDNEGAIGRTISNVEQFSQALGSNAPGIDRFMQKVGDAADRIGPLAEKLEALTTDVQGLVRAVDARRVARSVENIESFTQTLADNRDNVTNTFRDAAALAERLNGAAAEVSNLVKAIDAAKVNSTLANLESFTQTLAESRENVASLVRDASGLARSIDAAKINNTLTNLEGFTKTLADNRVNVSSIMEDVAMLSRRLNENTAPKLDAALTDVANLAKAIDASKVNNVIDNADKFATALGNSSQDVEAAIKEARSIAEKLNQSADRVDAVLKGAETFLGSATGQEGTSAFGEVREAARSIRTLAENLDRRTSEISAGLTRFSNTGLREYEALATEGRKTLNDISRTVRSLERNPNQVIFGGRPNIPEYNARR
jgi:phospholipid/cholesterol/gamma-HCH transport system substrate-binding protein